MNKTSAILLTAFAAVTLCAADKEPLPITLPKPIQIGTPVPIKEKENLEATPVGKRPAFLATAGAKNLALNKSVTSSAQETIRGEFELLTDGDKDGDEGCFMELGKGPQWVQIDLGASSQIDAVAIWHFHSRVQVYFGVVVQVSDDADFITGVTTIFNNDTKNTCGRGAGSDKNYIETNEGKLFDAKGVKARHVRFYSNGNHTGGSNHYIEAEVWGVPAK